MKDVFKVASDPLKIQTSKCTFLDCECQSTLESLMNLIRELLHGEANIVVWQMQSIVWGKWKDNQIIWTDDEKIFEKGWIEIRIFNENEEVHLYKDGNGLKGRYRSDTGENDCEYVDSFARFWGSNEDSAGKCKEGFVCLEDKARKLKLEIPVTEAGEKWYGLLTRNYVEYNSINGQAGYTDFRFVAIASGDFEGA